MRVLKTRVSPIDDEPRSIWDIIRYERPSHKEMLKQKYARRMTQPIKVSKKRPQFKEMNPGFLRKIKL